MSLGDTFSICGVFSLMYISVLYVAAAPTNVSVETGYDRLSEMLTAEQTDHLRLQTEVDVLQDKFTALERGFQMQMQMNEGWLSSKSRYSFSAVLGSDTNIYQRQTLIFDQVLNNVGDAYNPMFGHFTVPINGTYHISVTITVQHTKIVNLNLMKNKIVIYNILAGDSNTNYYETGSALLILDLVKDDVLYVRGNNNPDYVKGSQMTSFSGFLLYTSN